MKVRDLFYGPEKLRALWRVLLFLIWTTLALTALGTASSMLLTEDLGSSMLAVVIPHGLLCLALLVASYVMMRWAERKPFVALGLLPGSEGLVEAGKGALIGGGCIAGLVVAQTLLGWLRPAPMWGW